MTSLNKRSQGFTIVELLIVIVVIGILATLVIVTFTGVNQRARDSQRQTDITALNSQLEVFYAQNGYYPTLANLNDSTYRSTNFKGLDAEALVDPKGNSADTTPLATATSATEYGYVTSGCDATTNQCTGYELIATLESGGTFTKKSNT